MRVVGVDISVNATAIAVLEDKFLESAFLILSESNLKKVSWSSRLMGRVSVLTYSSLVKFEKAVEDVFQSLSKKVPDKIVIEGYAYATRGRIAWVAELTGILKLVLLREGMDFTVLAPSVIKKIVAKKGSAKKSEVAMAMYKKLRVDLSPLGEFMEDVYDACAAAYAWMKLSKKAGCRYDLGREVSSS